MKKLLFLLLLIPSLVFAQGPISGPISGSFQAFDQDLNLGDSPTFVGETLTGLTASLPVFTDGSKALVSKSQADTRSFLGLGSAAYTASTAYDAAGTATGKIAASIVDGDLTHTPDGNSVFDALALKAPLDSPVFTTALNLLKNQAAHTAITIENTDDSGLVKLNLKAAINRYARVDFSDTTDAVGSVTYDFTNDRMSFKTAGTVDRLVIDGDGNVLSGGPLVVGTSGARIHLVGEGVAPTTSPLNASQFYSVDVNAEAGKNGLHIRGENTTTGGAVVGAFIKADTGDYAAGASYEGMMVINTTDNTLKVYAEAGWRQIATW